MKASTTLRILVVISLPFLTFIAYKQPSLNPVRSIFTTAGKRTKQIDLDLDLLLSVDNVDLDQDLDRSKSIITYGILPKWIPECEKVFLDLGANIGVTSKKLFEPEKYPKSKIAPYFQKAFGPEWLNKSTTRLTGKLCALGFEPNPRHYERLTALENEYSQKKFNLHFFHFAISTLDGNVTYYTTNNSSVSQMISQLEPSP